MLSISSLPASILEKSSTSPITVSSASALERSGLRVVALLGVKGVEKQVGHADDAVHGGTYLVAHVGQEQAFGLVGGLGTKSQIIGSFAACSSSPVGGLGRFFGPMHLFLLALALGDVPAKGEVVFFAAALHVVDSQLHRKYLAGLGSMNRFEDERTLPFDLSPVLFPTLRRLGGVEVEDGHAEQFLPRVAVASAGGVTHIEQMTFSVHP